MKKNLQFQYSILHYVHDLFTEEKLNIGLALYSPENDFFKIKLLSKYSRITGAFPSADGDKYSNYISRLQTKFDDLSEGYNQNQIRLYSTQPKNIEELLTQVLPIDDSSINFSPIHFGTTSNLEVSFSDLYFRLVEKYLLVENSDIKDEKKIWHEFSILLPRNILYTHIHSATIRTPNQEIEFDHVWKNGHYKALQPLSFDLKESTNIKHKSLRWFGTNVLINSSDQVSNLYYILSKPKYDGEGLIKAYNKAKDLLGTGEYSSKVKIIEEDEVEDFANSISKQIQLDIKNDMP